MKNAIRVGIFGVICVVLVVSYYFYLSHKITANSESTTSKVEVSEMEEVLNKDFASDYPATPRMVIKWYNRIISLYYDEDTTDEQLSDLCDQAMMLMDSALLQENPRDTYIASVKADVQDYANHERKILETDVCGTNEVEYRKVDGDEMSYVIASYALKDESSYSRIYQMFALRKNDDGEWKILAFERCDKDGNILE